MLSQCMVLIISAARAPRPEGTVRVTFSLTVWKCALANDLTHLGSIIF